MSLFRISHQSSVQTCMMTGTFATTAISAITSQNTQGVMAVLDTPVEHLKSQMDAVLSGKYCHIQ